MLVAVDSLRQWEAGLCWKYPIVERLVSYLLLI
jgi:hypothetical protein